MGKLIGIDLGERTVRAAVLDSGKPVLLAQQSCNPEESLAIRLMKIAEAAQLRLGEPITSASIALPASWEDDKRQQVLEACKKAGLHDSRKPGDLRLISSLGALAMADYCGPGGSWEEAQFVLVVRLEECLEAAVAESGSNYIDLAACQVDSSLSSGSFYGRLAYALANAFLHSCRIDVRSDAAAMAKLQQAAKEAARQLKSEPKTVVSIPDLAPGIPLRIQVTREQFLKMTQDLTVRLLKIIHKLIKRARDQQGMPNLKIQRILLAGDTPNIYGIAEMLRADFEGAQDSSADPALGIVFGAAYQTGLRSGVHDVLLMEQYLHALHLEAQLPLLPSCTAVPYTAKYRLAKNGRTSGVITLAKTSPDCASPVQHVKYIISGIPKESDNDPGIELTVNIDRNGIWALQATDIAGKQVLPVAPAGDDDAALELLPMLFREPSQEDFRKLEEATVKKMLPVFDNLVRAWNQPTTDSAYKKGVELTLKELRNVFREMGAEFYGSAGESFDPNIHEAVVHIYDGTRGENEISLVIEHGVRMHGKILRYAKVQVAN